MKINDVLLQALAYQVRKVWKDLRHLTLKFGKYLDFLSFMKFNSKGYFLKIILLGIQE